MSKQSLTDQKQNSEKLDQIPESIKNVSFVDMPEEKDKKGFLHFLFTCPEWKLILQIQDDLDEKNIDSIKVWSNSAYYTYKSHSHYEAATTFIHVMREDFF